MFFLYEFSSSAQKGTKSRPHHRIFQVLAKKFLNFEKTNKKLRNDIFRDISKTIVDISQNSFPTVSIMKSNGTTEVRLKINDIKHSKLNNKFEAQK